MRLSVIGIATTLGLGAMVGASLPAHADEEAAVWIDALLSAAAAVERDDRHHDRERHRDRGHRHPRDRDDLRLSERERRLIQQYFGERDRYNGGHRGRRGGPFAGGLPPGLQKQAARGRGLPPGWRKKASRGDVLPRDIYRHRQPLPADLLRRLPVQPRGTELYRIDGDVVRVITATRVLADILGY